VSGRPWRRSSFGPSNTEGDPQTTEAARWQAETPSPVTRLTNAFSHKLANHKTAVAVFTAVHNFVKMHRSLRMTPAMKAGLARRPWTVADLLAAS